MREWGRVYADWGGRVKGMGKRDDSGGKEVEVEDEDGKEVKNEDEDEVDRVDEDRVEEEWKGIIEMYL